MGYKVEVTHLAAQDLDSIVAYLEQTLSNPMAASALLDGIEECFDGLESMPMMHGLCLDPRLRELEYRRAPIKNYIMVYKVDEPAKKVQILRFFYGAQDYEKLI